ATYLCFETGWDPRLLGRRFRRRNVAPGGRAIHADQRGHRLQLRVAAGRNRRLLGVELGRGGDAAVGVSDEQILTLHPWDGRRSRLRWSSPSPPNVLWRRAGSETSRCLQTRRGATHGTPDFADRGRSSVAGTEARTRYMLAPVHTGGGAGKTASPRLSSDRSAGEVVGRRGLRSPWLQRRLRRSCTPEQEGQ